MVLPASHRISRVPHYSGYPHVAFRLCYRAFTYYSVAFQTTSLMYLRITTRVLQPRDTSISVWAFFLSLVTTQKISFDLYSTRYLDISVPRVCSYRPMNSTGGSAQGRGLPHSEIFGLTDVNSYPKLIAVFHVLHRLLVPMHPPYALNSLKFYFNKTSSLLPTKLKVAISKYN